MIENYGAMVIAICLNVNRHTRYGNYGYLLEDLVKLEKILGLINEMKNSDLRKEINKMIKTTIKLFDTKQLKREEIILINDANKIHKITEKTILMVNSLLIKRYAEEKKEREEIQKLVQQTNEGVQNIKKIMEARETGYQFVESSPVIRSLKDKISLMIDNIQKDGKICITGYFDNCLLKDLKKAMDDKKVTVRIIHPTIKRNTGEDKRNLDALNRIIDKSIGEVRYSDLVHARIFLIDDEVIVSSADMKNNSLGGAHFEAGIYSNDLLMVEKVKDFFESIWNESEEKA